MVKKIYAYQAGDMGSIPGSGRSPGEGNGNSFQYSSLENFTDRGYSPWDQTEKDKYPIYMWNLKKKKNEQNKNSFIDTKNSQKGEEDR